MRRIIIVLFIFTLHACCNRNSKPTTPAQDSTATPIDTTLEVRYYEGILPAADCEGIRYDLTLTNQKFNGDGTYHLTMTYLKANRGKDHAFTSTGDFGTLRGSADDINATVYQLNFNQDTVAPIYFLYKKDRLVLLNQSLERAHSKLNYTLLQVNHFSDPADQ